MVGERRKKERIIKGAKIKKCSFGKENLSIKNLKNLVKNGKRHDYYRY